MHDKEEYFKLIFPKLKHKVHRLCLGFMGNKPDADDLLQEVLLKVWAGLDNFKEESSIDTWVYRITTNTALNSINKIKKDKKRASNYKTAYFESNINHQSSDNRQEQLTELHKAIATLKDLDRIIISLVLEDTSYKEISEITGISTSNVGVRLSRIKRKLQTIIN